MKAKCPYCKGGCDKCQDGYWEVTIPEKDMYLMVCMNRDACGCDNGGTFSEGFPDKKPQNCVLCGKPCEWVTSEEYPDEPPAWIENQKKYTIQSLEKQVERLREDLKKTREIALSLTSSGRQLTVEEAQYLDVCRVCKRPTSAPFILNYGEEFAHEKCLPADKIKGSKILHQGGQ